MKKSSAGEVDSPKKLYFIHSFYSQFSILCRRYAFCCTFPVLRLKVALKPRTVGVTHHRVLWSPDFPLPEASRRNRVPAIVFQAAIVPPAREACLDYTLETS